MLGFVKITLGKQTQQSTDNWLWRGHMAGGEMKMYPFSTMTMKTGPLPKTSMMSMPRAKTKISKARAKRTIILPAYFFLSWNLFFQDPFLRREEPRKKPLHRQPNFWQHDFLPPPISKYYANNITVACGGIANQQSSRHVELHTTWCDDHQFAILSIIAPHHKKMT